MKEINNFAVYNCTYLSIKGINRSKICKKVPVLLYDLPGISVRIIPAGKLHAGYCRCLKGSR